MCSKGHVTGATLIRLLAGVHHDMSQNCGKRLELFVAASVRAHMAENVLVDSLNVVSQVVAALHHFSALVTGQLHASVVVLVFIPIGIYVGDDFATPLTLLFERFIVHFHHMFLDLPRSSDLNRAYLAGEPFEFDSAHWAIVRMGSICSIVLLWLQELF